MYRGQTFSFHVQRKDIFFSWIEGRHLFSMDEAKIFFHTWSRPDLFGQNQGRNFFSSKLSNGLLVAPLFIDEEIFKLCYICGILPFLMMFCIQYFNLIFMK